MIFPVTAKSINVHVLPVNVAQLKQFNEVSWFVNGLIDNASYGW